VVQPEQLMWHGRRVAYFFFASSLIALIDASAPSRSVVPAG
jgi:hypothetical protein